MKVYESFGVTVVCLTQLLTVSVFATNLFQCNVADFYAGFNPNGFSSVAALKSNLRTYIDGHTVISYTSTTDPLRDLDEFDANNILDIYSLLPILKSNFPNGWNREHVWPRSRGVGDTGADTSDLFNLFASDVRLNSARGNLFFDECVIGVNGCISPAGTSTFNAAPGTMESSDTWAPPPRFRGDLARTSFYMAVRYDGSETNTPNLELFDCSTDATCPTNNFGRLSTLLKWHREDPVSAEELLRVSKICTKYQGTRNPFVDFPQLAEAIFGTGSSSTSAPTPLATSTPTRFPTPLPTPLPTPFPTPFPTAFPVAQKPVCADSIPSGLVYSDGSPAPCNQVSSVCNIGFVVAACPNTCGTCPTVCSDKVPSGLLYTNDEDAFCVDIAQHCTTSAVSVACPVTCNSCFTLTAAAEGEPLLPDELKVKELVLPGSDSEDNTELYVFIAAGVAVFAVVLGSLVVVLLKYREMKKVIREVKTRKVNPMFEE